MFGKTKNTQANAATPPAAYASRVTSARANIAFIIVLTVVNIILSATGGSIYFLFSASVPYLFTVHSIALTGHLPDEVYADPENGWEGFEFYPDTLLWFAIAVSVVILALYAVCFFASKKQRGWLIVASVLFGIDTLALIAYTVLISGTPDIIDIVIHIYMIFTLIYGSVAAAKLNRMPAVEPEVVPAMPGTPAAAGEAPAVTVEAPAANVEAPAANVEAPAANVEAPAAVNAEVPAPADAQPAAEENAAPAQDNEKSAE